MNTTVRIKASEIYKDWHVIDAAGRPLGRVATEAATLLRGKHKPTYEPHLDDGDFVIIINAAEVKVTGRKSEQIKYYTHSGYPGGLRTRTYEQQLSKHPERVLEKAVWGMLPGGSLGEAIFKHLKVYKGAHHPHQSQITGSERAKEARLEAQKGNAEATLKAPPRLRKLSVPEAPFEPITRRMIEESLIAARAAEAAATPKPKRGKAARVAAETPDTVEEPVAVSPAIEPTPVAEAPDADTDTAVSAEPDGNASEAETPKRARATRPKATTAKAEPADGESADEKKPARRRAPAKTEE
jgi:large subunit ribosomal protein L13